MAHGFYQMVSRPPDGNGNSYRLLFVYAPPAELLEVVEVGGAVGSLYQLHLEKEGYRQIGSFHLTPTEYNAHKRIAKQRGMLHFRD